MTTPHDAEPDAFPSTDPVERPSAAKLVWFQFFGGDWLQDRGVRMIDLEARGLWIDMLCVMSQCSRRGYLEHAPGRPLTTEQLARIVGASPKIIAKLIAAMEQVNIFSRDAAGTIYSRRMVRDEQKRLLCSAAGKKGGGNPTFRATFDQTIEDTFKGLSKGRLNGESKGRSKLSETETETESKENTPPSPPLAGGGRSARQPRQRPTAPAAAGFDPFWAAFPKKVARLAAAAAWRKLAPGPALVETILAAVERHKRSDAWTKEGGKYVPNPATWLNGQRWTDEVSFSPSKVNVGGILVEADGTPAVGMSREEADRRFPWSRPDHPPAVT
jgi:hypothetical protein